MMKYNGMYMKLFPIFLRKYMNEEYGKDITKVILKKAPAQYKKMLNEVEDIGYDNPMAHNIYMAFVFMAIWKVADGFITPEDFRRVMRRTFTEGFLRHFVADGDLNAPGRIDAAKAKFRANKAWADEHPEYKEKTWDFNFDESRHKDGSFYYFTRCPLNDYARKYGYLEILPVCCEMDHLMTEAKHGKLIREYTLATDGPCCDYWIVPDGIKNPE